MRPQFKILSAISAVLLCSAGSALEAQRAQPANPAQPATPPASPPTTTVPDEPASGRSTAPDQAGTVPGQSATAPGQTATTPGQEQTSPGEASQATPAVTGTTPSAQTTAPEQAPQLTPVTRADLKTGLSVYDQSGATVGKIESVSAKGAVISTGTTRATIPVTSFARGDKGLVIGMSKADIDAAAKKKSPK